MRKIKSDKYSFLKCQSQSQNTFQPSILLECTRYCELGFIGKSEIYISSRPKEFRISKHSPYRGAPCWCLNSQFNIAYWTLKIMTSLWVFFQPSFFGSHQTQEVVQKDTLNCGLDSNAVFALDSKDSFLPINWICQTFGWTL